jgi:DNA-directed RNA polymerase subunit RPC12/RpoP
MICKPIAAGGYVVPGSLLAKCSRCGQDVNISPSTLVLLVDHPGMEVVCWTCGAELFLRHPGPIEGLTSAQLEEIEDWRRKGEP